MSSLFYDQNEQSEIPSFVKRVLKWKLSNLMDYFNFFPPDLSKTFFIHEMSKNNAHTLNEYLLNTQNGNL